MDLNAFWGLAESPGVAASDQDGRQRRTVALAAVRAVAPVDESWDRGDPAEVAARVPRTSALFGKVA